MRDNIDKSKIFSYSDTHFNVALGISTVSGESVRIDDYERYIHFEAVSWVARDGTFQDIEVVQHELVPCD